MIDDAGSAARRELLTQVRGVVRATRLLKAEMPLQHPAVPPGTMQILALLSYGFPAGDCHLKDLAAHSSLDPSTVSRAVSALVKAGLVARSADPDDGRASVLALTPHGHQTLHEVYGWLDDRLAEALAGWTSDDLALLTTLMQRLGTDLTTRFDHPLEAAR